MDRINHYYKTYQGTVKLKPADVKLGIYIDSSKGINVKDPKFKIVDIVAISKYKKGYDYVEKAIFQTGPKNFFVIKKVTNTFFVDAGY